VSRVSLAFRAKGFYIGSDLVDLIFEHEVHYQNPEFTTTSASNTANCDVQQITRRNSRKSWDFFPWSLQQNDYLQIISIGYALKHQRELKLKKTWAKQAGEHGAARCRCCKRGHRP
jgi:hypothetical protein